MLTAQLNEARQRMKAFDEIDLERWEDLLNHLKKLAKFTVTLKNINNGLELIVTGEDTENDLSLETINRHPSGLIPITPPQLQSTYHNHEILPTRLNNFSSTNNVESTEVRSSVALVNTESVERVANIGHHNRARPAATLVRRAAAEIPFEHRRFYHMRWRVDS
ncbi:unnamed protein product [Rotaria sp. Silwood2]|nr:unnamed protein product [Rotaria sp. Silwood2]CAF4081050.1 unnamed protein product [Rotaria sp. Silwood2]